MEKIQSLNYSAHALDEFETALPIIRKDMSGIRDAHVAVISLLRESVKFVLPNRAELFDMGELRQAHVDMARLPFPVVALEAPWFLPDGEGGDKKGGIRSSRRIALCMTLNVELAVKLPATAEFLDDQHGGVVVLPLYWKDATAEWMLPMGGVFIPHDNEVTDYAPGEASVSSRLLNKPFLDAGVPLRQLRQFRVAPFVLLPEMVEHALSQQPHTEVMAHVVTDARDEVAMLLQTCVVLNCSNVTTPEIAAPKMLNRKRIAKGKQPFFSYRVLQVEAPRGHSVEHGGKHASPCGHLRRGHIRRLEGRTIWVRASLIKPSCTGEILHKAYSVKPMEHDGKPDPN